MARVRRFASEPRQPLERQATLDLGRWTALVDWDPESGGYVGMVPGVPGAHAEGWTLEELGENLLALLVVGEED